MSGYQGYQRVTSAPVMAVLIVMATLCLSGVYCAPNKNFAERRKMFVQLKNDLASLKCEPKLTVVPLEEVLEFHDALHDQNFYPMVVAVHRCIESCSFCGNLETGMPVGKCLPLHKDKRPFLAQYVKDSQTIFQEVLVEEHKTCECSA